MSVLVSDERPGAAVRLRAGGTMPQIGYVALALATSRLQSSEEGILC